jgi:hypothetical protein
MGIGAVENGAADLAYATNRLHCAERRLYLAKVERDEARRAVARAKENLAEAKRALREMQKKDRKR